MSDLALHGKCLLEKESSTKKFTGHILKGGNLTREPPIIF